MSTDDDKVPPGGFVTPVSVAASEVPDNAATSEPVLVQPQPDSDLEGARDNQEAKPDSEDADDSKAKVTDKDKDDSTTQVQAAGDEQAAAIQVSDAGQRHDEPAETRVGAESKAAAETEENPKAKAETEAETEGEGEAERAAPSAAGKRKAPPAGLMLQDVPPPEAQKSIEIDTSNAALQSSRSRASTLSRPFTPSMHHTPDSPTTTLIATLRNQLEMVAQQAEQLNAKLIASISKHADLEDQVFTLQESNTAQTKQIDELARDKARWEESMNTGLLVERSQISAEMQRLAAGLVEEERKRGTAEEKRKQVEDEVDELSATLFDQANTMVATERMARSQAEQRLKDTEESLAAAEAAVRDMQAHMQALTTNTPSGPSAPHIPRRYLSSHPPYREFQILLSHLRAARPSELSRKRADVRELFPAPLIASLVQQPFIARCIAEDYDPTVRLESAADLGWVSRRSVSAAILSGDLLINPVSASSLGPAESISCALCGRFVFGGSHSSSSSKGIMKYFAHGGAPGSRPQTSVYVFRVATDKDAKSYPLCKNGWCLERLRAACALWHFVRTGIVHPVWFGEDHNVAPLTPKPATPRTASTTEPDDGTPVQVDLNATPPDADKLTISPAPGAVHGQRSASAPVVAPPQVTLEGLAAAEYRRPPPPPPQRKSGWGLGSFGLGSGGKSSGGWTSWGSRPSTPATPATPDPSKETQRSVSAAGALGAPITLDNKDAEAATVDDKERVAEKAAVAVDDDQEEKKKASTVDENTPVVDDKSPIVDEKTPVVDDKSLIVDEKAPIVNEQVVDVEESSVAADEKPALNRTSSTVSHRSQASTDIGSFATPTGDNASLPDVNGLEETKEGERETSSAEATERGTRAATPEAADNAGVGETEAKLVAVSPSKDAGRLSAKGSPAPPPRSAGRAPPPPPLPKRSARRVETPPITPTTAEAAQGKDEKTDSAPATPTVATPTAAGPPSGVGTPTTAGPPIAAAQVEATPAATEGMLTGTTTEVSSSGDAKPIVLTSAADTETSDAPAISPETPATPSLASGLAASALPAIGAASPSQLPPPPPRHPLAIMRSPEKSPRRSSSSDDAGPRPHPPPPPRRSVDAGKPVRPAAHSSSASTSTSSVASPVSPADGGDGSGSGGRTFLTGEEWEARTWRQIIKIKEDMWRARVGVLDDDA